MTHEELARIKRAIATGTDLLLNEMQLAFDRQEHALADARNTIGQLRHSSEERTARENQLIMLGDLLAHQLTFKEHGPLLKKWWEARGNHCTVCNGGHEP